MAKPINVVIKGDYTDRDIQRAIRDLDRLKTGGQTARTSMASFASSMKSVVGPALIGAAAAAGTMAVAIGVDAVKAAIDEEAASRKLAQTLKNLGFEAATLSVEEFVDATQRSTGVADDELRPALDRLVRSTKDVSDAQALLNLALDISAGTGKTLEQTVEALSRASDGNTTSLKRLGTGLDEATLKTKDMNLITAKLSQTFEGQAAVAADTLQGKMARLSVAMDELKETLGEGIIEGFTDGMSDARVGADDLLQSIEDLEPAARMVGQAIGGIAASLTKVVLLGDAFRGWIDSLPGPIRTTLGFLFRMEGTLALIYDSLVRLGVLEDKSSDFANATFGGGNFGARSTEHAARYAMAVRSAADAADKLADSTGKAASGSSRLSDSQTKAKQSADQFKNSVDRLASSLTDLIAEVSEATGNAGKATFEGIDKQIQAFKQQFEEAKSFAQGIVSTFMDGLDLGAALASAKEAGTSIVEEFVKQGNRAKEFGARMKELLAAGLSKSAMRDIMDLGFDRGLDVMKALQDGNVRQNIDGINEVYQSVEDMANTVADQAKAVFYDAGLNLMLEMLRAMIEELMPAGKSRKRLMALMDNLAASMNRTATITVQTVFSGGTPSASEISAAMPGYTGPTFTAPVDFTQFGAGLQLFADGGIATSPTFGVFGEAGPEALIPLDRMGSMGGNTYNINVSTGVGDPRQIGEQVVSYIKRFEAASGPVFARA